jgi:hypothetical protein
MFRVWQVSSNMTCLSELSMTHVLDPMFNFVLMIFILPNMLTVKNEEKCSSVLVYTVGV